MKVYNKDSLPKHVVQHSPDGFSWGYGGSGPSELARCLILEVMGNDEFYQDFKWDFVAKWGDDWQVTEQEIKEYVSLKQNERTTPSTQKSA